LSKKSPQIQKRWLDSTYGGDTTLGDPRILKIKLSKTKILGEFYLSKYFLSHRFLILNTEQLSESRS